MNKEELLKMIKDDVAEKHSYPSWSAVIKYPMDAETRSKMFDEVANRYAIAMCEAQKEACSENADIHWLAENNLNPCVDKQSILNTKNVAE